jgi:hypothetical protein
MLNARFVPLTTWPGVRKSTRRAAPFRSSFTQTLDLLEYELARIAAKDILIEIALSTSDIRNDGWPRADTRPTHPGVILSFTCRHGALRYPCDTYSDWQANLHALALALQALRAVDRYGATSTGQQYSGWAALPAPGSDNGLEPRSAAQLLLRLAGRSVAEPLIQECLTRLTFVDELYRQAAKRHHTDVGGKFDDFVLLQRVVKQLRALHNE